MANIQVTKEQLSHYETVDKILDSNKFIIDNTIMGGGKTHVHTRMAYISNLELFVVGPGSGKLVWKEVCTKYHMKHTYITYASLTSKKGCVPSHGYLTRKDKNRSEGSVKDKETIFKATSDFKKLVNKKGIYLVFDEAQQIKNRSSSRYDACKALIDVFFEGPTISRFALLSGSPIQEFKHCVNLLRLVGYIKDKYMYRVDPVTRIIEYRGLNELLTVAEKLNPEEYKKFIAENKLPTKKDMTKFCFKLYCRVLIPVIQSEADPPNLDHIKLDYKNGIYDLPVENKKRLKEALDRLAKKVSYDEKTGKCSSKKLGLAAMQEYREAEIEKVNAYVKQAKNILLSVKKSKIIAMFSYTSSIDACMEALAEFNPIRYDGSVKEKEREGRIIKFNTDPESRVIIGNLTMMGESLNLQDKVGDSPRYMFKSATFRADLDDQASRRIYRLGSMSDVYIRNVFIEGCEIEAKIVDAIQRKTEIMKECLPKQKASGRLFPGDLKFERENGEIVDELPEFVKADYGTSEVETSTETENEENDESEEESEESDE